MSALKAAQQRRTEIESGIASCRKAIDLARQKIETESPDVQAAIALRRRLEDAAAEAALGAPGESVEELATELRLAEERAAQSRNELEKAALPGLLRRIEAMTAQTGEIDHQIRAAVQSELQSERAGIIAEYLDAAETVATCISCLRALSRVAGERGLYIGPLWGTVQPAALPCPVGTNHKILEESDGSSLFGNGLLERLEAKAVPAIAARYDELLGA